MALTKVTYTDLVTIIGAQNLNDIQDAIIALEEWQSEAGADIPQILADIAPRFSNSTSYSAGDCVIVLNKLYQFTAAHPAGNWTGTDATEVNVTSLLKEAVASLSGEVDDLKSATIRKSADLNLNKDPFFSTLHVGAVASDTWGFDTEPVSYNVTDGVLTFSPASRAAKLRYRVSMINGHQYFMYCRVDSSSTDFVATVAGMGVARKNAKSYASSTLTWTSASGDWNVEIQCQAGYTYAIQSFILIDLTANEMTEADALAFVPLLTQNKSGDLEQYLKTAAQKYYFDTGDSVVNVKEFGAIGDGVNDDTAAIASAISACPANGTVYLPKGTYYVQNIQCKSNMTLLGDGANTEIKLAANQTNNAYNCVTVNNVTNVVVKDLSINGNKDNNASTGESYDSGWNGVHISGSQNIVVSNVIAHDNGYHGVIMVNVSNVVVKDSEFYNNGFRPVHGHDGVRDVKVMNCKCYENGKGFSGDEGGGYDAIFFFGDAHNVVISGCEVKNPTTLACIEIGGNVTGNTLASDNFKIVNNNLESSGVGNAGVRVMGRDISNVLVSGNSVSCYYGISLESSVAANNFGIVIAENTFKDCIFAIRTTATKYDRVTITGNSCLSGEQFGIWLQSSENALIVGNIVSDYGFGIVCASCNHVVIGQNYSGSGGGTRCICSLKADNTNTDVKMVYNITDKQVINDSDGGIVV